MLDLEGQELPVLCVAADTLRWLDGVVPRMAVPQSVPGWAGVGDASVPMPQSLAIG